MKDKYRKPVTGRLMIILAILGLSAGMILANTGNEAAERSSENQFSFFHAAMISNYSDAARRGNDSLYEIFYSWKNARVEEISPASFYRSLPGGAFNFAAAIYQPSESAPGTLRTSNAPIYENNRSPATRTVSRAASAAKMIGNAFNKFRGELGGDEGSITIIKSANPEDDTAFNFTSDIPGGSSFTLMDPSDNTEFFGNVPPGTYNVTEMVPAGWDLVSIDCGANQNNTGAVNGVNIVLEDSEHVECTFNNSKIPSGSIRIIKNANLADDTAFNFTSDIPGGSSFTLMDPSDNTEVFNNVPPGTYNVTEIVPSGWDLVSINCGANQNNTGAVNGVNIVLEDGESVECTFNNKAVFDLRVIKYNDLNKDGTNDEISTDPNNPSGNTLAGWEFTLYNENGVEIASGTTSVENANSGDFGVRYTFMSLFKGEIYFICETPQPDWVNSEPGVNSAPDPGSLDRPCKAFEFPLKPSLNTFANIFFGNYEMPVTAAMITVSGRVMTPGGRGLPNATVHFTDQNGNIRTTRTNPFGYYRLTSVEIGQTFIINVYSKRFQFMTQVVNVYDSLSNLDFVAEGFPKYPKRRKGISKLSL